jgi:hypothetical protein
MPKLLGGYWSIAQVFPSGDDALIGGSELLIQNESLFISVQNRDTGLLCQA